MYDDIICQIPVEEIFAEERLLKRLHTNGLYQTTNLTRTFDRYIITKNGVIKHAEYQPVAVQCDKLVTCSSISNFSGDLILQQLLFDTDEDYIIKIKAVVCAGKLVNHFMKRKLQLLECRRVSNIDRINFYKELSDREDRDIHRRSKITYKIKTFFEKMKFAK